MGLWHIQYLLGKEVGQLDQILMNVITTLQKNKVEPIEMNTWNESYRPKLEESIREGEDRTTKQICKMGKLDIKYKKPTANKTYKQ